MAVKSMEILRSIDGPPPPRQQASRSAGSRHSKFYEISDNLLVLLLLLCNDEKVLGPLTNPRWLNAIAATAVTVILGLSTLLTITTILPRTGIGSALLVTLALLALGGLALAKPVLHERRHQHPDELTPWQRHTWTAPMLELLEPASLTRARVLGLALLRGYTTLMVALLLIKLGSLVAT